MIEAEPSGFFDVTLIIPFFNEEKNLAATLDSLVHQNLGNYKAEILLMNGKSTDLSTEIAESVNGNNSVMFKMTENIKKSASAGLNLGISLAQSDIIGFGGAHAIYPPLYLLTAIELISTNKFDAVGGRCSEYSSANEGIIAQAMTMLYQSPLGAGARRLHRQKEKGYASTVFGGFYKKEIFLNCGGYDETLIRGQDIDFAMRIRQAGYRIYYHPDMNVKYLVRTEPSVFFSRSYKTGRSISDIFVKRGEFPSLHYLVPLVFDLYLVLYLTVSILGQVRLWLLAPIMAYILLLIGSAIVLLRKARPLVAFATIPVFACYHITYGLGVASGYLKRLLRWCLSRSLNILDRKAKAE